MKVFATLTKVKPKLAQMQEIYKSGRTIAGQTPTKSKLHKLLTQTHE